jgi:hypothetical protein
MSLCGERITIFFKISSKKIRLVSFFINDSGQFSIKSGWAAVCLNLKLELKTKTETAEPNL